MNFTHQGPKIELKLLDCFFKLNPQKFRFYGQLALTLLANQFLQKDPILEAVESFTAQIAVQEHPGQLKPGFSPGVYVRTGKSSCKMATINWKIGKKTVGKQAT